MGEFILITTILIVKLVTRSLTEFCQEEGGIQSFKGETVKGASRSLVLNVGVRRREWNDPLTRVVYLISCIADIYIMIHNNWL